MKPHLGCSRRGIKGWVNVYLVHLPHVIYNTVISNVEIYDDHSQTYLPHMEKENGPFVILNVEAEKC